MSLVAHKGNLAEEATAKKARKVWDDDGALYFPDPSDDGESDDDDLSSVEDFVPDGEEIADALSMNRKIWVDFAKGKGAVRTTVSMAPPGGLNKHKTTPDSSNAPGATARITVAAPRCQGPSSTPSSQSASSVIDLDTDDANSTGNHLCTRARWTKAAVHRAFFTVHDKPTDGKRANEGDKYYRCNVCSSKKGLRVTKESKGSTNALRE
jgi:hypothetical protein